MEKRKALSKARLVKTKIEVAKGNIDQLSTDSFNRGSKTPQGQESLKKSITPTPSRLSKPKTILNKRTSDTPKVKVDDLELKRRSMPNIQENLESYYTSYIKALTEKIEKHKSKNYEIEEELKQMELNYKLEESSMRKEIERLGQEVKKIKKDKLEQETSLMEENFRIRREFEEFKTAVNQTMNEIIPLVQIASEKSVGELEGVFAEILKKIFDVSVKEHDQPINPRLSLKDTASFSNAVADIDSPVVETKSFFKEAIVLYSHVPSNEDEIELKVGDRVTVFNNDENNNWWVGKVGDFTGKFPRNCVMLD